MKRIEPIKQVKPDREGKRTGVTFDPRTKFILAAFFFFFVVATKSLWGTLIELAVIGGLILVLGWARTWIKSLKLLGSMVMVIFLIGLVFFDLDLSLTVSARLITLVSVFFVFFQSTLPEDIGNSLIKIGLPHGVAFILAGSMRYVPVIMRKVRDIMDAQKSRGISLEMRLRDMRNFLALLAPLLTQSFMMAEELAKAMESRGFGSPNRSFAREYRIRLWEYGLMAGFGATLFLVWVTWRGVL